MTTNLIKAAGQKNGRSGGIRTHYPLTPSEGQKEIGSNYSQLEQRVET